MSLPSRNILYIIIPINTYRYVNTYCNYLYSRNYWYCINFSVIMILPYLNTLFNTFLIRQTVVVSCFDLLCWNNIPGRKFQEINNIKVNIVLQECLDTTIQFRLQIYTFEVGDTSNNDNYVNSRFKYT